MKTMRFVLILFALVAYDTSAKADVTITFYARPWSIFSFVTNGPQSVFGHAFISAQGPSVENGFATFGFSTQGPLIVFGPGHVLPEGAEEIEQSTPYVTADISDDAYRSLLNRMESWNTVTSGKSYNALTHNCASFTAEIARQVGLKTGWAPGNMVPEYFMEDLLRRNPDRGWINHHPMTLAEIEATIASQGPRNRAALMSAVAANQNMFTASIDASFSGLEAARQASLAHRSVITETERAELIRRLGLANVTAANSSYRDTRARQAQIEATTNSISERIHDGQAVGFTIWSGQVGGSSQGSGAGGASGSGVPGLGGTTTISLDVWCEFFSCIRPLSPRDRQFRAILPPRDRARIIVDLTNGLPATGPGSDLSFSYNGVSAPDGDRAILHLGSFLPGETREFTISRYQAREGPRSLAVYSSGALTFSMPPAQGWPRNRDYSQRPSESSITIRVTAPTIEEINGGVRIEIPKLTWTEDGRIIKELFLSYDVFPGSSITVPMDSGELVAGNGAGWSEWYALCLGRTPLVGYLLDPQSLRASFRNTDTDHPRSCGGGWSECLLERDTTNGPCFRFRAQGHEKHDRPFDSDVGIQVIPIRGEFSATYNLARPAPHWLRADSSEYEFARPSSQALTP